MKVVLSIASVGVPLIIPVFTSKVSPGGKSGEICQIASGTLLAGYKSVISVLLTKTTGASLPVPNGLASGPPIQTGSTEFGPSQIPSSSVSGSSESVPMSLPST